MMFFLLHLPSIFSGCRPETSCDSRSSGGERDTPSLFVHVFLFSTIHMATLHPNKVPLPQVHTHTQVQYTGSSECSIKERLGGFWFRARQDCEAAL